MGTVVHRAAYVHSYRRGRGTLTQRFQFGGDHATADAIIGVLLAAPLVGEDSVFGNGPGRERNSTERSRSLRDFSPAPGFRFDVDLKQQDRSFVVRFSQPDRHVPYLQGDVLWVFADRPERALLEEQINTERALQVVSEPLGGPRRSLRWRLFFLTGHKRVMFAATRDIAELLDRRSGYAPFSFEGRSSVLPQVGFRVSPLLPLITRWASTILLSAFGFAFRGHPGTCRSGAG